MSEEIPTVCGPRWRPRRLPSDPDHGHLVSALHVYLSMWRTAAEQNLRLRGLSEPSARTEIEPYDAVARDSLEILRIVDELARLPLDAGIEDVLSRAFKLAEHCRRMRARLAWKLRYQRRERTTGPDVELRKKRLQELAMELFPLKSGLMLTRGEWRTLCDSLSRRYPQYRDEASLIDDARNLGLLA